MTPSKTNVILNGDSLTQLKTLPEKSINMCMTSPPYWALRDYGNGNEQIWGGDENCEHGWNTIKHPPRGGHCHPDRPPTVGANKDEMLKGTSARFGYESNTCNKCGAWKGQLGLEPTFDQYISNLCDIFGEVKRVLKDDGTCWVNLGDTYFGSGKGAGGDGNNKESFNFTEKEERTCHHCNKKFKGWKFQNFCGSACSGVDNTPREIKGKLPDKCLTMIPQRFAIEMVNRGWILRNVIIWHKPNAMPCSVKDRFTVDFEYIFFFSKRKKYYFETQYEPHQSKIISEYKPRKAEHKTRSATMQPRSESAFAAPYNQKGRNKRTVWEISTKNFSESHFAVYPEELCETPIAAGCPKGGVVLDPFFGAGTTGVVALKQEKKFIGIELNPEYIEIANKRLKPYMNQTKLTTYNTQEVQDK